MEKYLFNNLRLAYSPLSAYEFSLLKHDKDIIHALKNASIYIIAKRPTFSFNNFQMDEDKLELTFEVHQKNNSEILHCKLPLVQDVFGTSETDVFGLKFEFEDDLNQTEPPLNHIKYFGVEKYINHKLHFVVWFTPEKFLQNFWNDSIKSTVTGEVRNFLIYETLYIGKATKQHIFKRLKGHETFQDILSLEPSISLETSKEVTILALEFSDNLQIDVLGKQSTDEEILDSFLGNSFPEIETVFLDTEKALINSLSPKYNKELFKNYPISKDGLHSRSYTAISYKIIDPITLLYKKNNRLQETDFILIKNDEVQLVSKEDLVTDSSLQPDDTND